jgi:sulfite exporter TauE/SafE/copper chaperone CopZ
MASIKSSKLQIGGMTCTACPIRIEKALRRAAGVLDARVNYAEETLDISSDEAVLTRKDIEAIIHVLGYTVLADRTPRADPRRAAGILIILFAAYMLLKQFGLTDVFNIFPAAEVGIGYGMLFVIGLLTSLHCVAMCGGINLSQCIPPVRGAVSGGRAAALRPSLLYNLGRVVSYTVVGFLVGALGSAVTFTGGAQGVLKLVAGAFMIIMGVNMLGIFPWLRRFVPRMPQGLSRAVSERTGGGGNGPLVVGLLNGLMPCGPLQTMQIYALSTGSPVTGALSMLLFALGTAPLMFGLGALSSALSRRFTHNVMTAGAALIVLLGLSMLSQGMSLSGFSPGVLLQGAAVGGGGYESSVSIEDDVQVVRSTLMSGRYPAIEVRAGMPVKWIIDAPQGSVNGCNGRLQIPEYGITHTFEVGENIIEFTPERAGSFPYSCWMGMIRSTITVLAPEGESA